MNIRRLIEIKAAVFHEMRKLKVWKANFNLIGPHKVDFFFSLQLFSPLQWSLSFFASHTIYSPSLFPLHRVVIWFHRCTNLYASAEHRKLFWNILMLYFSTWLFFFSNLQNKMMLFTLSLSQQLRLLHGWKTFINRQSYHWWIHKIYTR